MMTIHLVSMWITALILQAQPERPPEQVFVHVSIRILVLAAILAVVPLSKRAAQWMRDRRKMSTVIEHEQANSD